MIELNEMLHFVSTEKGYQLALTAEQTLKVLNLNEHELRTEVSIKKFVGQLDLVLSRYFNEMSFIAMPGTCTSAYIPCTKKFSSVADYASYMQNEFLFVFDAAISCFKSNDEILMRYPKAIFRVPSMVKTKNFAKHLRASLDDVKEIAGTKSIQFFESIDFSEAKNIELKLEKLTWKQLRRRGTLAWSVSAKDMKKSAFLNVFKKMHSIFPPNRFRINKSYIILKGKEFCSAFHMDDHSYPHTVLYHTVKGKSIVLNFNVYQGLLARNEIQSNPEKAAEILNKRCCSRFEAKEGETLIVSPYSYHLFYTVEDCIVLAVEAENSSILRRISTQDELISGQDEERMM